MHLISLSFDDGMARSFLRIAEIYEKFNLAACLNVIATGHLPTFVPPDAYHVGFVRGDFTLWNVLQERGHEIMPHGLRHEDLSQLPFPEAQRSIMQCLDIFARELKGFRPEEAVFNFPYNASTPELEAWLPTVVRAFRCHGEGINPLPFAGQVKLTTTAFGPENCEHHLEEAIARLLARPAGWLIYNLHGLDDEGWGPIRAGYLEALLARLTAIDTVVILPVGRALTAFAGG